MRLIWTSVALVAGCGALDDPSNIANVQSENRIGVTSDILVRPQARPAENATTELDAPALDAVVGTLGRTVASLGNAAEPGLWLRTPLVRVERRGRVFYPETGKSVAVTLIPIEGPLTAGSRLSPAAMQDLGAPLTGLPEVDVFAE